MRISILLAAILTAGSCASVPGTLAVRAVPRDYSPAMSSTIGIGLTPVFESPDGTGYVYHWHASFGYFVSASAAGKVAPLGPDADSPGETLYWTYDPRLTAESKPTVAIVVEAVERKTDRVLARKKIKLDWDHDTARVRED